MKHEPQPGGRRWSCSRRSTQASWRSGPLSSILPSPTGVHPHEGPLSNHMLACRNNARLDQELAECKAHHSFLQESTTLCFASLLTAVALMANVLHSPT